MGLEDLEEPDATRPLDPSEGKGAVAEKNPGRRRGVSFVPISRNRKLAPVKENRIRGWMRFEAIGPYVASTYVSIQKTCRDSCRFKNGNGCYAESGHMGPLIRDLDADTRGLSPVEVAQNEAYLLDSFGPVPQDGGKYGKAGRDLRLHISGDAFDVESARVLAGAAQRWRERGGGKVWAYTHSWANIEVGDWGEIQVLASCETPAGVRQANLLGYAAALVVRDFRGARRAYSIPEVPGKVIPCPAETKGTTCVQCRLCLSTETLRRNQLTIGFSAHGRDAAKARRHLPILDSLFGNIP